MILRLIQNEFIKIFSQIGWKISVIFILLIAVGAAPYTRYNTPDFLYTFDGSVESHQKMYEFYKQESEQFGGDDLRSYSAKSMMEVEKFYIDNKIDTSGWRRMYSYQLEELSRSMVVLHALRDGYPLDEVAEAFGLYGGGFYQGGIGYEPLSKSFVYYQIEDMKEYSTSYDQKPYNENNIPEYIKETQKWLDKVREKITSGKKEYSEIQAAEVRERLAEEKIKLEEAQKKYELDSGNPHDYYTQLNLCSALEIQAECWEKFADVDDENDEVISAYISRRFETILDSAYAYAPNDESNFENSSVYYSDLWGTPIAKYGTYKEYADNYAEKAGEDYINTAKAILYLTENQVLPGDDEGSLSAKRNFISFTGVNVYIVMFFTIFLAAVIMPSEFSSGAIRLLVIRPCARWKLLLSKLLTVVLFCGGMFIISEGLTLISTVAFFGWGDLSEPCLEFVSGRGGEITPILYALRNGGLDILSAFMIMSFAFFLGAIFSKGVFSIAAATLVFAFGKLVSEFSWRNLLYNLPFLKYTPVPYVMNLNEIRNDAFLRIQNWYNPIGADYGLDIGTGVIVILVTIALFIAGSFVVFNRKQINN